MPAYRDLVHVPGFVPLFAVSSAHVAAHTVTGLALATLVFRATGSPLLSALAMFGPSLAQLAGATLLLSAADRLPPRAALTGMGLLFALGTAAQALPGLSVGASFSVLMTLGLIGSVGGGVRYGLLNEILTADSYLTGRSLVNMSAGAMQILGFAVGGALVAALSPRGTLLVGAALYLLSAAVARFGLRSRPPRASGRPSVRETWRSNRLLWSSRSRRYAFLALWLPNGLVVGCESLYVSYAPDHAGLLFACGALGMLTGDLLAGRLLPPRLRSRLGSPLALLLAVPHLLFFFGPPLPLALAAVTMATVGYGATLLFQERLLALTPHQLSGHALGLHSSGMLSMQGVAAAVAGGLAQLTSPATGIGLMAAVSVLVTLILWPGLRDRPTARVFAA
ncbi:Major Facilitator Superfamily protein [Streptomyces sp. YIM 130001]|uniref:MFS transporter n=1 Tax=Streptomyces sp. YIM 130001 TaxID=2259644 RepID=UPI000E649D2E|nr:MFS transporter [Streptomyces sp. YIM 130001]RII14634.1 Major Facilitator Superfamily protein [Streptomyces sp. YIM 130001]